MFIALAYKVLNHALGQHIMIILLFSKTQSVRFGAGSCLTVIKIYLVSILWSRFISITYAHGGYINWYAKMACSHLTYQAMPLNKGLRLVIKLSKGVYIKLSQ